MIPHLQAATAAPHKHNTPGRRTSYHTHQDHITPSLYFSSLEGKTNRQQFFLSPVALDAAAANDRTAVFPTQHLSAASRRAMFPVCCFASAAGKGRSVVETRCWVSKLEKKLVVVA